MTKPEWLACDDPVPMLRFMSTREEVSERKLRLFCCACVRRLWRLLTDERSRQAVEAVERYFDGAATVEEIDEAVHRAAAATWGRPNVALEEAANAAYRTAGDLRGPVQDAREVSEHAARAAGWEPCASELDPEPSDELEGREKAAQADLLRDIDGNPYRIVKVDRSTLATIIVALARAAYNERGLPAGTLDPLRLGVLADALEEAGGTGAVILSHLRSEGPHVRGCWAVDLLLGHA